MCTCGHIEESFLLTLLHFVLIFKSTQPISNWETRQMLSVLISCVSVSPMLNLLRVVCVLFSYILLVILQIRYFIGDPGERIAGSVLSLGLGSALDSHCLNTNG